MNFAFSHHGTPVTPDDLWTAWNFEPSIWIPLVIIVWIYAWGMRNVWKRASAGHGITKRHYSCFLGALLALLIAFASPLDALSDVLFSAHMVQHMVLILIAAPLLVMSDFPLAFLWAVPRAQAQNLGYRSQQLTTLSRIWRALSSAVFAWLLFALTMWVWHASTLYEAALRNEAIHALEHLVFLGSAMLFWWALLKPTTQKHVQYGMAIPYLFTTILQSGILGALMTFSSRPWYSYYTTLVTSWGITPLQDQQLAGLIMWIPGGAIFTLLDIGYFAAWLRVLEERSLRMHNREILRARYELRE
jgi:putative membrane protein